MSALEGFLEALRHDPEMGPKLAAIEALEADVQDAADYVMLDIAFSPVLLNPGDTTRSAVEVAYKAQDGRYVIKEPYQVLSEDETKLARARYLVTRGKEMQPAMDRMFGKETQP